MFTVKSSDESLSVVRCVESPTRKTKSGRPFLLRRNYDLVIQHVDEAKIQPDAWGTWILAGYWRDDKKRQEAEVECIVERKTWYCSADSYATLLLIGSPLSGLLYPQLTFHPASQNVLKMAEDAVNHIVDCECRGCDPHPLVWENIYGKKATGVSNSQLQKERGTDVASYCNSTL